MDYKTGNHSKYCLKYHFIFVCKYRKPLLPTYGDDIKNKIYDISKTKDFNIQTMECDKDHIHILIESKPKVSPLMIARCLKQETTVWIWKKYGDKLYKEFWVENTFWSDGYFVCTTGEASTKTIEEYIANQG